MKNISDMDTLLLDQQLQENILFADPSFPVKYYVDDLNHWADHQVPLHWHMGYEFFSAVQQDIEVQVGHDCLVLRKGESILVGGGQMHSYRMTDTGRPCLCPNIVFTDEVLALMTSVIFRKYFGLILNDATLPYIVFSSEKEWQKIVSAHLFHVYAILSAGKNADDTVFERCILQPVRTECPEIEVHQDLVYIFQILYCRREELYHTKNGSRDRQIQIRIQKMLCYIQEHFRENISLEQLAASAGISRSEAGRCFQKYYSKPPMSYVTLYRLKYAQELLAKSSLTVNEVAIQCGFRDSSYFVKVFRKHLGQTPSEYRNMFFELQP